MFYCSCISLCANIGVFAARRTCCRHRVPMTSGGRFLKTLTRLKASVLFQEYCSASGSVQEPGRSLRTTPGHQRTSTRPQTRSLRPGRGRALAGGASSGTRPRPAAAITAGKTSEAAAAVGNQRCCADEPNKETKEEEAA